MPSASEIRANMSVRHILNPVEDTDRGGRPTAVGDGSNVENPHVAENSLSEDNELSPTEDSSETSSEDDPTMFSRNQVACEESNTHSQDDAPLTVSRDENTNSTHQMTDDSASSADENQDNDDDLKVKGHAERHECRPLSQSLEACDNSDELAAEESDHLSAEEANPRARKHKLQPRNQERWMVPLRRESNTGEATSELQDEMEGNDKSFSPRGSDNENDQQFNLSSPTAYQQSSQTTEFSTHRTCVEHRRPPPLLAFRGNGSQARVQEEPTTRPLHDPDGFRSPKKRQRKSPSPELHGDAIGPRPRKSVKSIHTGPITIGHHIQKVARTREHGTESSSTLHSKIDSNSEKLARLGIPPASLILSPSKSKIYTRRKSTSPTRLPPLTTPLARDPRISLDPISPPLLSATNSKSFNIFTALMTHPELVLEVGKHVAVNDLINLYATSKAFRSLADSRFTALIMGQAIGKASESARTFSFRAYRNLCKRDPAGRIMLFSVSEKEGGLERVATERDEDIRFVPSFRWLKMVLHHEAVVDSILRCLGQEGHRLPKRSTLVLKKLWFTLDISDNGRRIGLLHDSHFWSNKDLFVVTLFFIKLDMRLTDPNTGVGEMGMRKLLLAQKSLETLARVLAGQELRSQLELLRLIIRFDYTPSRPLGNEETIFGIPAKEVGKLCYEGWGKGNKKLVPIDELISREAVRRKLQLQKHYVDMMLYGYINKRTFEDVRTTMSLLPKVADDGDSDSKDETSDSETESENERTLERRRRERMGLFEGETDEEVEDDGEEQDQESSLDEQGLDFAKNAENDGGGG